MGNPLAFAVCGRKNSGRTALIEAVVRRLVASGLEVVVVKDVRGRLEIDRPAGECARFFDAGAGLVLRGCRERLVRLRDAASSPLESVLADLSAQYDLVLVEGHEGTPLPKVWLAGEGDAGCPADGADVLAVLARDCDRPAALLSLLGEWLPGAWLSTPVLAGVLIGGGSSRMGRAKHLLHAGGRSWIERTVDEVSGAVRDVVLIGRGEVPTSLSAVGRLPDVREVAGPMAGILSAMRWAPRASWLIVACDMPCVTREAVDWLLSWRRPGVWAAVPRAAGGSHFEPLFAHYDFRARSLLEELAAAGRFGPTEIAASRKAITPLPPPDLAAAWSNVNTPADLNALRGRIGDGA